MPTAEANSERIEVRTMPTIGLDDDQWRAFQDILDRPVSSKPRLASLFAEKSVLE